jgi:hypothetical protein
VLWSVVVEAAGDRVLTREEVVELADAVSASGGIASGIGRQTYGAQLLVEADSSAGAIEVALLEFHRAVEQAQLPPWPVSRTEATSQAGDLGED